MPSQEAAGIGVGSVFNAAGSIAGGFLGQQSLSDADQIRPSTNTRSNLELAAANYDALRGIGFGDIANTPSPFQVLVDQAMQMPLDEKRKRRGISSLYALRDGNEKGVRRELESVIFRLGYDRADIMDLLERDKAFKVQQKELSGLGGLQTSTIMNRARGYDAAADLTGSAANALRGGAMTPLMQMFQSRLNRSYDDSEERMMLQGRFGGFNPALGMEQIADLRADSQLKAIEQTLLQASNLQSVLSGGLANAQTSAGQSSNAALSALNTAANQANAANAITASTNANNATSMGNGVAGAFGAFGDGIMGLGALGGRGSTSPTGNIFGGGGSSIGSPGASLSNPSLTSGYNFGNLNGYGGQ